MADTTYRDVWEQAASTPQAAAAAVDGSTDEKTLQATGRWTARQVAAALLLQPTDRVLELGCGVGRIGRELAPQCQHWQGVDLAENMLRVAKNRTSHLANVAFQHVSRTSLSMFAADSFDKAYAVAVLIHLDKEDVFLYLREVARVLRPGGLVYFDMWNLAHAIGWKRWMLEVEHWANGDQVGRKDVARNQFCVPQEIQLYVQRAGLTEALCLTDSYWIQMVAVKPGTDVDVEQLRAQLRARQDQFCFSPVWSRLFGTLLDVLHKQRPPLALWHELQALGELPEAELYRQYFLGIWHTRQDDWGAPPE